MARADAICSVSAATRRDVERLLGSYRGILDVVPLTLSFPYGELEPTVAEARLEPIRRREGLLEFVLHVGSNQRRKNREGVIHTLAAVASSWDGKLVFAGQALTPELKQLARQLGVADRIVEVIKPSNQLLEALYNAALALLFPSRFEGFGWPIIEAQSCGCPVICSDRAPFPDVAGEAAMFCDPDGHVSLGSAVVTLSKNAELRESLRSRGHINAQRFGRRQMIARFVEIYGQLLSAERPAVAAA
jgi:glycosyltransferase involved in cell wall biosynthesis